MFPRHKVCGEFLSPGVVPVLEQLGAAQAIQAARPHMLSRFTLHFPGHTKQGRLDSPGLGLSRYRFDQILLEQAIAAGADFSRAPAPERPDPPLVIATGRKFQGKRGGRLFGFKAHFTGPQTDAVELFFFDRCYIGLSAVEGGATNICGLGPEETLQQFGFEPDALIARFAPLRERIAPLRRSMDWLVTGPLYFRHRLDAPPEAGRFPAGDQLSFADPFTGTGMLNALLSGAAAGRAAAEGEPPAAYLDAITRQLRPALRVSAVIRWAIETGIAGPLTHLFPSNLLVRLTRP